jgi:large subunit ribosomal protein L21
MYAVIRTGGKQYRVAAGETLRVEKLPASAGDKLTFDSLLFADDAGKISVGSPHVSGIMVEAEVVEQGLGKKIVLFKYKRRKSYRRKNGHRQPFTAIRITAIGGSKAEETAARK